MYSALDETLTIYSAFGDDPDLAALIEMFVEEMPGRIATLERAFAGDDSKSLQHAARQLHGAAGCYGFRELATSAASLECAVREWDDEETIRSLLDDLLEVCDSVRAGAPQ